jgi:uncharacterized membrane protein
MAARLMLHSDRKHHSLPQLIARLAGDGIRVAEAELGLARSELNQIIRSYAIGIVIGAAAVAVLIVALTVLAQGAALALSAYLGSVALASTCVGAALLAISIGLIILARYHLTRKQKPVGLLFRWLKTF